jgi:MFS family permease
MIPEGAVLDWGALYLSQEHRADATLAGFAYAAFSGTMALMRFGGDSARARLGDSRTFIVSAVVATIGLVIAGQAPNAAIAVAGFLVSGIGMANTVPILFSAAGSYPGVPPAVGIAVATAMGYAGLLLAPAGIGFIAEHTGFAPIFTGLAIMLLFSGAVALVVLGTATGPRN